MNIAHPVRIRYCQCRGGVQVVVYPVPGRYRQYLSGTQRRGVAQLGSAPRSGRGGRRFKSDRPDQTECPWKERLATISTALSYSDPMRTARILLLKVNSPWALVLGSVKFQLDA